MKNTNKLIIFVKAPVAGQVKTRLAPALTYEKAARLYQTWAQETYRSVRGLNAVSVEVAYQSHPNFPTPQWLEKGSRKVSFFLQDGKNLGERLYKAFRAEMNEGPGRVVIIGTDSPGLPLRYLKKAFRSLIGSDMVLGPTQDGGYYLIGFKNKVSPQWFKGIRWSTSKVFSQTLEIARRFNLSVHLLPQYFDIDRPEDLKYLKRFKPEFQQKGRREV